MSGPGNSSPVIGLIGCRRAFDRQGDALLRFEFGGVNGLGIQVKRCGHLGVAQRSMNRLYVLASADQKRCEAVTEIVEAKPLTRFQPNSDLNRCGANLVRCHYAPGKPGRSPGRAPYILIWSLLDRHVTGIIRLA